jgi:hypothetical protein
MNERKLIRVRDTGKDGLPTSTTLKRWEDVGLFPKRRAFGPGMTGWWADDFYEGLDAMAGKSAVQTSAGHRKAQNAHENGRRAALRNEGAAA